MRALLDVNVLIALLDAAHIHHRECEQIDISNLAVTDYLSPVQ